MIGRFGRSRPAVLLVLTVSVLLVAAHAAAAERYAIVVSGASGGEPYAEKYQRWTASFVTLLRDTLAFPPANVIALGEAKDAEGRVASRDGIRAALATIAKRATKDDLVLVVVIGHGTADGEEAKFNLVGPDLTAREWDALLDPIAARIVFINGASGSFPFMEALSGRGRIVITAADTPAQQFETVFPAMLLEALEGDRADTDKNGRVSVWEAFVYAGAGVRSWYEQRGQLATERPLLDDTGDGVGGEAPVASAPAPSQGTDGALARTTFLRSEQAPGTALPAGGALLERRDQVAARIDALRAAKGTLPPEEYERQLEALLLELAGIDRELRR